MARNWWRKNAQKKAKVKKRCFSHRRLAGEVLEDRRLLATLSLNLSGSTLTFNLANGATSTASLSGTETSLVFDAGSGNTISLGSGVSSYFTLNGSQETATGSLSGSGVSLIDIHGATGQGFQVAALNSVTTAGLTIDSQVNTTTITGATVNMSGNAISIASPVSLSSATTSITASSISFGGTVDGGKTLQTTSTGATTFSAAVGGTTPLSSLTTTAGAGSSLSAVSVTTTGAQTYGSATVTLNGTYTTTNSAFQVTSGATTLAGATVVSTGSGAISFGGTVTQGADAHLTGSTLTLGPSWNAASHSLWLTFTSPVTVPSVFTNIDNFTSDGTGGTTIAGSFTTSGSQTYGNAATLTADATLASTAAAGGNISFSKLDGAHVLQVNTAGATIFGSLVGSSTPLTSLTTDAPGTTQINGGGVTTVITSGAQTYNDPVNLGANTTLTGTGGSVYFGSTVDSGAAPLPLCNLTINAQAGKTTVHIVHAVHHAYNGGNVSFQGTVGGVREINDLTVNSTGRDVRADSRFAGGEQLRADGQRSGHDVVQGQRRRD